MTKYVFGILLTALFAVTILITALQFHNAQTYPATRGFDATAHIDYIEYIRATKRLPLPNTGWETHQPPLYYVLASLVPAAVSFNIVGLLSWLALTMTLGWYLTRCSSNLPKQQNSEQVSVLLILSTVVCVVSLPVVIYLSTAVGNEFFATLTISGVLAYYGSVFAKYLATGLPKPAPLVLGLLLGLALLSKSTSLVLIIAILAERLIATRINFVKTCQQLAIPFIVAGSIGGWFYARNIYLYGNPIYQPADYIPLHYYDQPIVDRTLQFLFSPTAFFNKDLFVAHHSSLLVGTYYSWFYDCHGVMIPRQPFTKLGTILIILSVPFFILAILGFITQLLTLFRQRNQTNVAANHQLILPVYSLLLMAAYVHYNFRLPFFSTVKASFISSLLIPFTYFLYLGLNQILTKSPPAWQRAVYFGWICLVILYAILITRHFWVQSWWYV